jgi:fumarate hydratase class II
MRMESDSLGEVAVPADVYWGAQTARALANFPVSGIRADPAMIVAYAHVKRACAVANRDLGRLSAEIADAIRAAADEVIGGGLAEQFVVDVFQAGAGTSFNMNVNEVLANRALELGGRPRGDYSLISPNDHVNMGQSSNDTFPTATHVAVMLASPSLLTALDCLADALADRGEAFWGVAKAGRTHLEDAVPVRLGQEFRAYASAVRRAHGDLSWCADELGEVALGGTATGTGLLAGPGFRAMAIGELSRATGLALRAPRDSFEAVQSRMLLSRYSAALKTLALELIRIANDIRLLGSGPTAGFHEIELPAVQPGSSIMPGKANPVMAECLDMIAFQVVGADATVSLATQAGQLELNVMTPVIAHNILMSMGLLARFLPEFAARCVAGARADEARCSRYLESTPALATVLNPVIGYLKAAEVAKAAVEEGKTIRQVVEERSILSGDEIDRLFDPAALCDALEDGGPSDD